MTSASTSSAHGAPPVASPSGGAASPPWSLWVRGFHWSLAVLFALNFLVLDPDWALHRWAGYGVGVLVIYRLALGLVGPRRTRFSAFPPSPSAALAHARDLLAWRAEPPHRSHNPLGALMVYNLLVTLAVICLSGLAMGMDAFWGVEWVKEVHELAANWAAWSVLLHVLGVMVETRRSGPGVLGAMTGRRR